MRETASTQTSECGLKLVRRAYLPEERAPEAAIYLVHGLGDNTSRYRESFTHFVDSGLAVFGCDLPGHGDSEGQRGHYESFDQLHDIIRSTHAAAREEFPTGTPIGIFGHSMGGLVALDLLRTGHHSFQFAWINATLIDVSWGKPSFLPGLIRFIQPLLPRLSFPTGIKASECYPGGDDRIEETPSSQRRVSLRVVVELLAACDRVQGGADSIPGELPVLFTHDTDDTVCPIELAREVFKSLPNRNGNKKFIEYQGLLHEPWQNQGVLDDAADWIRATIPALAEECQIAG